MGVEFKYTTDGKFMGQKYQISKYKPLCRFDNYWKMSTSQTRIFYSCLALIKSDKETANSVSERDTIKVSINLDWLCMFFNEFDLNEYRNELLKKEYSEKEFKKLLGKKRTDKNRVLKQDIINAVNKWGEINTWTYMGDDGIFRSKSKSLDFVLHKGDSFKVFKSIEIEERISFGKKCKYINVVFDNKFNRFIFPKGNFVTYDFNDIARINMKYCIRYITFYEFLLDLKNWNGNYEKTKKEQETSNKYAKSMGVYWNNKEYPMIVTLKRFLSMMNLKTMEYGQLKANILEPCMKKLITLTDMEKIYFGKYDYSYPHSKINPYKNIAMNTDYLYFIVTFKRKTQDRCVYLPTELVDTEDTGDMSYNENSNDEFNVLDYINDTDDEELDEHSRYIRDKERLEKAGHVVDDEEALARDAVKWSELGLDLI